jgi:hypothetical protein
MAITLEDVEYVLDAYFTGTPDRYLVACRDFAEVHDLSVSLVKRIGRRSEQFLSRACRLLSYGTHLDSPDPPAEAVRDRSGGSTARSATCADRPRRYRVRL